MRSFDDRPDASWDEGDSIEAVVVSTDPSDTAARLADRRDYISVETVRDVEALIAKLDAEPPDCVVTDHDPASVDGIDLLSSVRERRPDLPVLLFPRNGSERLASEAISQGVTDYISRDTSRPYETLADCVESAVESFYERWVARELTERYTRLVENSPAPIVIYDDEFEVQFANDAAVAFAAAAGREDVLGRSIFEFVPEEGHDAVRQRMERILHDRERPEVRELAFIDLDGNRHWAEVASGPIRYHGEPAAQAVLNEITNRVERERRLRRERDRFTALFESIPQPVVHASANPEFPVVRNVNSAFESVFGIDADEITGDTLDQYIVPVSRQNESREIDQLLAMGETVEREVVRNAADGPREFLLRVVPLERDGDVAEAIGIYVDISDQKERERELRRQNDRLEEFASVVSHDLRNPLEIAMASLAVSRDAEEVDRLDQTAAALDRMETIIGDVLELARQGRIVDDPDPLSLERAAMEALANTDLRESQVSVRDDCTLLADGERLRTLFENLFRNALDHVGEDVSVEVGCLDDGFYVADDGDGIPTADRDEVFEMGHTTAEDGTGFGLKIVAEIADAHGWSIDVVESEAGGARFEITDVESR